MVCLALHRAQPSLQGPSKVVSAPLTYTVYRVKLLGEHASRSRTIWNISHDMTSACLARSCALAHCCQDGWMVHFLRCSTLETHAPTLGNSL